MSTKPGNFGPPFPRLGELVARLVRPISRFVYGRWKVMTPESRYGRERGRALRERLDRGETVYLLGVGVSGHNAGAALVSVSAAHGIRLICNEEEERYRGIKHFDGYPEASIEIVKERLADLGASAADLHACLLSWSYPDYLTTAAREVAQQLPASLPYLLLPSAASPHFNPSHALRALGAPARLGRQLGLPGPLPVIGMPHHGNHAYLSYATSPFADDAGPVMVTVMDGFGDSGAISLYRAQGGRLELLRDNRSVMDSLGAYYSVLSSTQGGWTLFSSEGRYMGAAAWGDNDRATNPYYARLRDIFRLGPEGQVHVNRAMVGWHSWGLVRPYRQPLVDILGPPIPLKKMWNPDAILSVDDVEHSEITRDRVNKAAAVQLVFEDALFHIIDHLIRTTRSDRLILTGGTALNCIANMRLLDRFDATYYRTQLGIEGRLKIWVPPVPGDAGVAAGAAYHFAMAGEGGVRRAETLRHAFYCGLPPRASVVRKAVSQADEIGHTVVGNTRDVDGLGRVADLLAFLIARGAILGLFHGAAETGPRALGHRSILADPRRPDALDRINRLVKFRERVRPLAPMATLEAARRFFDLSAGGAADDYAAYNYMVLTARAKPEALQVVPAIVHRDGTSRVQIVRADTDPFTHAYLRAMGRRAGVEMSVNTSLNVGGPIVQTPEQAFEALKKSRALSGILIIDDEGETSLVWHAVDRPPKDSGQSLLGWYSEWSTETGVQPLRVEAGASA